MEHEADSYVTNGYSSKYTDAIHQGMKHNKLDGNRLQKTWTGFANVLIFMKLVS